MMIQSHSPQANPPHQPTFILLSLITFGTIHPQPCLTIQPQQYKAHQNPPHSPCSDVHVQYSTLSSF
ncbi:hypothetical protein BO82DRAFT_34792 [Aspergillus uvarum CBS 121591]|uniref:Uncharacterized protein n=1 Tax=Aspergillus uvarum CBS 121591 TaxID=1448315 RepID=A0A319DY45_9EURO|nr:hypothetical protein BO82DRAFT_34792 [Aspergillus uvarum CBS 121591]PYH83822.1 hypothetical protein BO82DRAFT_34792 [Aspergillus uvarum CBS 121591]